MPSIKYRNKLSKLRKRKCVICKEVFWRHIAPSEIKLGKGKVCSIKCKIIFSSKVNSTGYYRKCNRCGKKFYHRLSEDKAGYIHKYCSYYCYHPVKRGKAISYDGYYVINGIKVHRLIMEKYLGRKLLSTEIVHHINFNQLDNRLANLQIVSRSEHNKIHNFLMKGRSV